MEIAGKERRTKERKEEATLPVIPLDACSDASLEGVTCDTSSPQTPSISI